MTDFSISRLSEAETAKALELARLADVATLPTTLQLLPLLPKQTNSFLHWHILGYDDFEEEETPFHLMRIDNISENLRNRALGLENLEWYIPALTFSMLWDTLCNFSTQTQVDMIRALQNATTHKAETLALLLLEVLKKK